MERNRPQSIDDRATAGKPQKPDTSYQPSAFSIRQERSRYELKIDSWK